MAATDNSIRTPLSSRRATGIAALDDDDIGPSPGSVSVGAAAKRCRPKPGAAAERCRPETHSQHPAAGNHHCTAQHYFKTNCASLINGTTNSIVLRFTHFVLRLTKRRRNISRIVIKCLEDRTPEERLRLHQSLLPLQLQRTPSIHRDLFQMLTIILIQMHLPRLLHLLFILPNLRPNRSPIRKVQDPRMTWNC